MPSNGEFYFCFCMYVYNLNSHSYFLPLFRSLPTLETAMIAFGIQKVYGKAFEKLAAFLQDLGGRQESDTLQNLLEALASEQNLKKNEDEDQRRDVVTMC